MSAAPVTRLRGRKGGSSKPKQPKESPDNLRSTATAKILIAVGEGEFDELPTAQDIYLDNTPLANSNGGANFPGVTWEWRPGSLEQDYIPGIPAVENETTLNVELRSDVPWVRTLSNTQLSAVRIRFAWPALQQQESSGDVVGYRIEYRVELSTDGGAFVEVLRDAVDGKTTTRYERSRRIDLPKASNGWTVRVVRITPNQNSNRIADNMVIAGITEVVDAKLRYPNTALLYIEFSAEQFPNIPAVTVECRARRVSVPSNYEPISRHYSGIWDGTFKSAWTDNPVWHTFDVVTNDRFGVGRRIKPWMVDRWEMYRIAQYCDQLVADGKGGQEPRFTCNLNLQSRAEAWKLLHDLSTIYRGMTYWAQGQLKVQADIPRATDFDFAFTRANVVDGRFAYSSSSERNRYSRALVSYDNPLNNYETDVAVATDKRLQLRYGDNPVEIGPVGCTRESQAQRHGKWAILTNSQDRVVTFRVGLDGRIPLPGYVVPVADSLLAGREVGGRISAVAGRSITLDRDTQAKAGDRLILNLPSGKCEGRTVVSVNGRVVSVSTAYSEPPAAELVWALDADDLAIPLYRVMKTTQPESGIFEITALQYEPTKFAAVDTGAKLETRPISVIPTGVIEPPQHVELATFNSVDQGIAISTMTISWPVVSGAVAYEVEWRKDSGNWIRLPRTGATSVDVIGIYAGAYLARVRAVSAFDVTSSWTSSMLTNLQGKTGAPPAVTHLTTTSELFGISLQWGFPSGAEDTQRTELWYGLVNSLESATKLADLAYPQADYRLQSLKAGAALFFWARLVDRTGNIGPFYPVRGGVLGQASSEAAPILDLLIGKITETQLGQDLLSEIEKIPALQVQIDALDGLKGYIPTETYAKGKMVVSGQRIYQAKIVVPVNNPPPNSTFWLDVGQSVETANGLAQQVATNTASISGLGAEAASNATLRAAYRDDNGEGELADALNSWRSTASIATESKVRATAVEAEAAQTTALSARVGTNEADITRVEQVVTSTASATAQQVAQLNAAVGNNSAAIQQTQSALATTTGQMEALWSVKMETASNGQKYAASFGLGLQVDPSGVSSQFVVRADTFMLLNLANGTPTSPFAVNGGQTFIRSAFIEDGSITMLKIGEALQSNNYVAGFQGWRLDKAGNLENNGSGAGYRVTQTNSYWRLYVDGLALPLVELGVLS